MNRLKSALGAAALAACGMAAPAAAAECPGPPGSCTIATEFKVYLDVGNVCTLTTGSDVDFGTVTAAANGQPLVASGSLIVRCNLPTAYDIALDQGLHGTSVGDRKMANAAGGTIDYQLYSGGSGDVACDEAGGAQWGDGSGGSCVYSATNPASDQTVQVRGISTLDNPVAGTYSDTVTATITW